MTLDVAALLAPKLSQRQWLEHATATMPAHELRDALLLLAECLEPCARSALLQVVAEVARMKRFDDGRRRR